MYLSLEITHKIFISLQASCPSSDLPGQLKVHIPTCANSTRASGKTDSHFRFSLRSSARDCYFCHPWSYSATFVAGSALHTASVLRAGQSLRIPVYGCFALLARATRSEQEGDKPLATRSNSHSPCLLHLDKSNAYATRARSIFLRCILLYIQCCI